MYIIHNIFYNTHIFDIHACNTPIYANIKKKIAKSLLILCFIFTTIYLICLSKKK